MTTIFKYFMFGKYGCLDTNVRGCCMHVFLVLAWARVTNSALAFTYIRIIRSYIAQWHSGMKSRPPFWIWTLDGFRCFAHARVSSS